VASTRIADHIGRVLGGRYRLLAPIGTGASAHVFLADDVKLRRRVAVKVLHPALADDDAFLRRFRAEAHAAAALNHHNIMAVYDWGEEVDGPYLVCEFLAGGSLRALLDRGHKLDVAQALSVGLQAAAGLDYAHRRGLVHRDIKPANLLFDDDGRLRIADFGLARALAEAAWTEPMGAVLGTARYASPEQVRGLAVDGKADVYSLAVVLVEACTGKVPFAAETTVATLLGRLDRPLEAPPEMGRLGLIVARAGRPDPVERIDAAGLGSALQSALQTASAELAKPAPLPLAGMAALDETFPVIDHDPTDIGMNAAARRDLDDSVADMPAPTSGWRARKAGLRAPGATAAKGPAAATGWRDPDATAVTTLPSPPAPVPDRPDPVGSRRARRRQEGRRRRWPLVLALVLALAAGGGAASWAVIRARVPTHPVPALENRTEQEADAALRALKFQVVVREEFSDTVPARSVISHDPPAGVKWKEDERVILTVSKGPQPTAVPDLSGMTEQEAREAVEAVGHKVGTVTAEFSEQIAEGVVVSWTRKGEQPPKGETIDISTSKGPEPRVIPAGLTGQTFEQAAAELRRLGLEAVRAEAFNDDDDTKGTVVSTSPAVRATVARGTRVTVTVSKGQPQVPRLNDLTVAEARAALEAVGLRLGSSFGPAGGKVFLHLPGAGTKVRQNTAVNVYVL